MVRPRSPRGRACEAAERLALEYPDARCELDFDSPWGLLVATILSAQCTDECVNRVMPILLGRFADPESLAAADPGEVEAIIRPTGFFRNKTKAICGAARAVVERFGGEVPDSMDELLTLPGVGRKTANVILWVAYRKPGIAVDTHVRRLTRRLGLTEHTDPVRIELDMYKLLPMQLVGAFGMRLILHGRRVCTARKPHCLDCVLCDFCPSAVM